MSRYAVRNTADSKHLQGAINHSKKRTETCSTTDLEQTAESKRLYDENYEAIFGKKELKHGRE